MIRSKKALHSIHQNKILKRELITMIQKILQGFIGAFNRDLGPSIITNSNNTQTMAFEELFLV